MQGLQDFLTVPELRSFLLASLFGLLLGSVSGVLVHEAGHAIAGRLAGYRICLIRMGQGPELFRLHLGLTLLVWRLIPVSGRVAIFPPLALVRHARRPFTAGGGIANALVAGGLVALLPLPDPVGHPILTSVLICQAGGILNLLIAIGPGRVVPTDGGLFRQRSGFRPGCQIARSRACMRPR